MRRICLAIGAVALISGAAAQLPELETNRARWVESKVANYRYGYNKFCECHRVMPPETIVTVSSNEVVDVHHKHADSDREVPARAGSLDYYWTIDDLFALLDSSRARGATVRATFNSELGYPEHVYVDYDAALVGDEIDLRLTFLDADAR